MSTSARTESSEGILPASRKISLEKATGWAETTAEIESVPSTTETDRIADLDMILIKMGICEFLRFPSIPVKVTINEYLEIAKDYSTEKSSTFINGVLDKIWKDFDETNRLNKIGRGTL